MKKAILKLMAFTFVICGVWSCSDNDDPQGDGQLKVTYANVAGTWQLTEWNGSEMNDDRYTYIILYRPSANDYGWRNFEIYQNFDSAKSRHITGTYFFEEDEDLGTIVSGIYDNDSGYWNHSYIISSLKKDTMTWVVEDDASDVSVYTRIGSIPEDVLNGTRAFAE